MFELMNQRALEVGAARRREVALETMRRAPVADGLRHAAGVAMITVGRRIAGEMPATSRQMLSTSERL